MKNYYQATESVLYSYRDIKSYVSNLEEKLIEANAQNWSDLKAIQYDRISVRTSNINRPTENSVMAKIEYLDKIKSAIFENKSFLNDIDKVLKTLDSQERRIVQLIYIKGIEKEKCMNIMQLKKSRFYKLKDKTINKFSVAYFGVDALKSSLEKIL